MSTVERSVFADAILEGRVAFVTGGGTGITGGVARALSEAGARVALVSRKLENLEPAAAKIRAAGGEALSVSADVPSASVATAQTSAHVVVTLN